MTKEELKRKVCEAIAARKDDIIALGESIFNEPELGYKETKTAGKVEQIFTELGVPYQSGVALTGVKGRLKGKESKYSVAVIGELDAVVCPDHSNADPISGAAHCCGHNVQIATMAAVGMGLKDAGIMEHLAGDVVLFAVPAEEYVEITYRNKLREEGKIEYIGGKPELIRIGAFDDVDMALQIHVISDPEGKGFIDMSTTSNGFVGKLIQYKGRASHAAAAPHDGVNALNAAMMGIMGVHAQRETFKDEDHVRFHPIITQGGDLVNVVPSDVRMESYVRAGNIKAIQDANIKVNRALEAGAMAVGAEVVIQDLPGYLPLYNDQNLNQIMGDNARELIGADRVGVAEHMAGSFDMGEVSHIMPISHPLIGGVVGSLHGKDYKIIDQDLVYVKSAQMMAMSVIDLLYGEAEGANQLMSEYKPLLKKDELLKFLDSFASK